MSWLPQGQGELISQVPGAGGVSLSWCGPLGLEFPPGASEGEGCAEMESWKGLMRPGVQAGEWRGGLGKAG